MVYPFVCLDRCDDAGILCRHFLHFRLFCPAAFPHPAVDGLGLIALLLYCVSATCLRRSGCVDESENSFYTFLSFYQGEQVPTIASVPVHHDRTGPPSYCFPFSTTSRTGLRTDCWYSPNRLLLLYPAHLPDTFAGDDHLHRGNHTVGEAIASAGQVPFLFVIPGEGFGLAGVYGIWVLVLVLLYPCKRYDRYKTSHKEKWWLSYL